MDYFEIIFRGYSNENDRKFLSKYFIRECKKAAEEHYDLGEFFTGLFNGIKTLKNECKKPFYKRENELYIMLNGAENGTQKYEKIKTKSVEEENKKTIEYCKNELSYISFENFPLNLIGFTNNRYEGNLHYNEVEFISNEITKAFRELNQPQQNETGNTKEVKKELHNQIFKGNNFEIWQRLFENFNINETKRTDLRFMYEIMKYKGQIHETVTVKNITDWINKTYQFSIEKLQYTSIKNKSNENRMAIYNLIK